MIFVLDATFSHQLVQGLHALSQEDCEFRYAPDLFGKDASDERIFAGLKGRSCFFVTLDARITRHPAQRRAMIESGIGAFVFTGRSLAQRTFRQIAAFVLSVADEMIEKARATESPFIWGISDRGRFERLD